jgi:serine/threonine protein kinase
MQMPLWTLGSIDAFTITQQIGEGTFGQVYKATHIASGKVVALKKVIL